AEDRAVRVGRDPPVARARGRGRRGRGSLSGRPGRVRERGAPGCREHAGGRGGPRRARRGRRRARGGPEARRRAPARVRRLLGAGSGGRVRITRRQVLAAAAALPAAGGLAAAGLAWRWWDRPPGEGLKVLSAREHDFVQALAEAWLPPGGDP